MSAHDGQGSAKRVKSSSGAPISASARDAPTRLPQYQPSNGARVSPSNVPSTATLSRTQANGSPSLKFTVKAAPSKLREATAGTIHIASSRSYQHSQVAAPAGRGVRSTRNPRTVVEPDSDDDEDMPDDGVEQELTIEEDEDEEDDEEEDEEMDDEEDAEGEDDDDELAANIPPPRPHIQHTTNAQGKPKVKVTAPREGPLKSVESKEVEDDDDDLSDLGSDDDELGDTAMGLEDDDDEDELDEDDEEDDDEDEDGSRSATPDLSKLTRRQRGQVEDTPGGLMALSNEAQKKKHISAEEHVMRRAEMARRRKNLSEKRNEEEKTDTINKLLSKPAPKRRSRAEMLAAQAAASASTPGAEGEEEEMKPDPVYLRWVNNASGSRIGAPIEWLESPAADTIAKPGRQRGATVLVEEVA